MVTKYDGDFHKGDIVKNITKIQNGIFKLLPIREEGKNWQKPLETLIIEVTGLAHLFEDQCNLLSLASKLEGLKNCDLDFKEYRRSVFECCGVCDKIKDDLR